MRKVRIGLLILWLAWLGSAHAGIDASEYTQTRIAEIHSMDFNDSTAIMSGYRSSFTGLHGYDLPDFKMYGSNHGSYQMLKLGMKVRVEYRLSSHSRIVVQLQEMPARTKLGVPDDIDQLLLTQ